MAFDRLVDVFFEQVLDHFGRVAVDAQADAALEKPVADFAALEREDTFLARDVGQFHRFVDQVLRRVELVKKSLQRDLEGAEKVTQRDAHQGNRESAADDDQ